MVEHRKLILWFLQNPEVLSPPVSDTVQYLPLGIIRVLEPYQIWHPIDTLDILAILPLRRRAACIHFMLTTLRYRRNIFPWAGSSHGYLGGWLTEEMKEKNASRAKRIQMCVPAVSA